MRILVAQLNPTIGHFASNTQKILQAMDEARKNSCELVITSEMAVCGYPPEDFLHLSGFIDAAVAQLDLIAEGSKGLTVIVGTIRRNTHHVGKPLFNTAAIIQNGKVVGFQDKSLLPTYDVFDERRYFEPASETRVWEICGKRVGITVCEDIWVGAGAFPGSYYHHDPVKILQKEKPELLINLSASPYSVNKWALRLKVAVSVAEQLHCPIVLCNQVGGNDSLIFDGHSLHVDGEGKLVQCGKGFEEEFLVVDTSVKVSFVPLPAPNPTEDLYQALVLGVRDYFGKVGFKKACLGLSGGIDSALVAAIAVEALGSGNVLGITMPSRYSSEGSVEDSRALAKNLNMRYAEIPIEGPFSSYLELLEPHFVGKVSDITEENIQARIRGMLLMAFSNKHGYIVLSTGNKSELSMGYCTMYGDMCGGLAVISDVPKMQVYALSNWVNRKREVIPQNTIQKPPSAELRPNQKDSDSLPDYAVLDNIVQAYVEEHSSPEAIAKKYGYSLQLVEDIVKKIHFSEYKRRQMPPGLRVTEKAFTIGWRFPIVQKWI